MGSQKNGGIRWTDQTWNPLRGCSRVSEGCAHCYAESMAARFCGPGQPYEGLIENRHWNGKVAVITEHLADPLRWKRPRFVFVNSMSDLFHPDVSFQTIAAIFGVMAQAKQHTFQILTKRPERMNEFFRWIENEPTGLITIPRSPVLVAAHAAQEALGMQWTIYPGAWPLLNVHLGVTVETQEHASNRVIHLMESPAALRWLSIEPMLGPIDLTKLDMGTCEECGGPVTYNAFNASVHCNGCCKEGDETLATGSINAVVIGGESRDGARPMNPRWPEGVIEQCADWEIPVTFKQWGEWAPDCLCGRIKPCKTTPRPMPGTRGVMFHCGKHGAGRFIFGTIYDEYPGER